MAFQSGVSLPGQVWDDWRAGTSLAGDIARLVGGGLVGLGGIKRQMDKEEADRAERAAEHARMASQFDRTLAQNDTHFNLGREDKYRLEAFKAAQKESLNGWGFDENGDAVYAGPTSPAPTLDMPKMSVPEAKAAGATYQQKYGADPMDVDSDPTPQERAALASGGFGLSTEAPVAPTRLAGSTPTPPLPVAREVFRRKERIAGDRRDDTRIALAQSEAAARARKEGESEAAAKIAARVALNPNAPVTQQDLETLAKDPQFTTVFGGIMERERARQAKVEEERKAQAGYIDQLRSYEGKIPKDSPYYRELTTTDAEGNPLPAKQLAEQLRRVESNLDDQTRAEATARRRSEIDARRAERNARADAALAGKLAEDAVKAEYAHVEDELRTVERSYAPWDSEKMAQDPTRKELLAAREKLAGAIQTAIKARIPTAPVAPAAEPGAYPSWMPDEARAEWDRLSPEAKEKVLKAKGR